MVGRVGIEPDQLIKNNHFRNNFLYKNNQLRPANRAAVCPLTSRRGSEFMDSGIFQWHNAAAVFPA
jgi:hypothetical protein